MSGVTTVGVDPIVVFAEIMIVESGGGDKEEISALVSSLTMESGDNCRIGFAYKTKYKYEFTFLTGNREDFVVNRNRDFSRFLQARQNQARRKRGQAASQSGENSRDRDEKH